MIAARSSRMRSILAWAFVVAGCASHTQSVALPEFTPGAAGERVRTLTIQPGVTATFVAPQVLDATRPVELILYALPNGNSTAETIGRKLGDGVTWRYDIQHIGAQTRALRAQGLEQAVVVYLEADTKSWPEWRRRQGYDVANARIVHIVDTLRTLIGQPRLLAVTLTGHSGGGSLMFGFIEGRDTLPSWLTRIAFLDANYNFETRHAQKLIQWLQGDRRRMLVSLAYDDRNIMLDGKKVVSDSGGTWRASHRMVAALGKSFTFATDTLGEFLRYRAQGIELLVHPNPQNRILHTEMIGEMNGYMHALLTGRPGYSDANAVLHSKRAYEAWIDSPLQHAP